MQPRRHSDPEPSFNVAILSRAQRTNARRVSRELAIALQRLNQLQTFARLRKHGLTADQAAPLCGSSLVSLWRWQKQFAAHGWSGLVPQTSRCGRRRTRRS